MTEPVVIWRPALEPDRYGNPIASDPQPLLTIHAKVAPEHPREDSEVGRDITLTVWGIYHRTPTVSGIRSTDLVEVRSPAAPDTTLEERRRHLVPIDGRVREWRDSGNRLVGEHIQTQGLNG